MGFKKLPFSFLSLIKFGLTGLSGLLIDFSLTWLLKEELRVNKFIANAVGFTFAVLSNYFINRFWTFGSVDKQQVSKQLSAFVLVSLFGLALNSGFIYLFTTVWMLDFYISKIIAVVLVFFWNFSANYFLVFKAGKQKQ
ncbi:GtrA family protein [Pedobacter duraquae]|uniref:Putative flippase GtrA n=1 Tax=Pedobacter duraquae TaxID=425511 RepID=A0A4V3C2U3_9SPHI|nr:GtrA family protein [Pedobacter duraquae]TDO19649.1 putative flippase GtrA [Pedobacter duraquae]